jgi:metallo-beta-lactamase family protein
MTLAKISHHGAVSGVTGSCHELHVDEQNSILIDCGLFQGAEVSAKGSSHQEQLAIDFSIKSVRALVITHVHIDHIGRIPYLLASGFKGPIYCSQASSLLLPEVLEDAVKIGFTRNKQLIKKFIKHIKSLLQPLEYGEQSRIKLNQSDKILNISLKPAGHILGSAYVECVIKSQTATSGAGVNRTKVIFSGDLGAPYAPLLPAPKSPYSCDQLILESTYGDRIHEQRKYRQQQLQQALKRAMQNRGVILIPAFSIGRTQELLYEIEAIIHQHKESMLIDGQGQLAWQDVEVILDSPLASEFTEKYQQLAKYWDAEAQNRLKQGRHPLDFSQLITINDHKTHLQTVAYLAKTARPAIVIAASGMCSGGRIVNYLKALIADPRTDILFAGYQARGTPGREIQAKGNGGNVLLDGVNYVIKAQVITISGYSAHADQNNLLNFIKRIHNKPKQIRLVHGDKQAKLTLQALLTKAYPEIDVMIPES